jgi:hypothetical protein
MNNSVLYSWQRFIDDQPKINERQEQSILLEMDQKVIDFLQRDIESAESGNSFIFSDIFGLPEESSPKTRMIMPYGNRDIGKMKNLMLDMFEKLYEQYNSNPNVGSVQSVLWNSKKETVQQKQKPLGWKEGDPINVVEKTISSPIVTVTYTLNQTKAVKTVDFTFGKLLQKYFPEEMSWWQGDRSKGITGKQNFFTSNTETMEQIVHDVKYQDEYKIRQEREGSANIVILSRHPIDVVRMSDFDIISSCHSRGGQYFQCAVKEAHNAVTGGGIIYVVNRENFDRVFPDGVIPQTGDIFNDYDRSIRNKLSDPISRIRLRFVHDRESERLFAVPDKKVYGEQIPAFREETFKYLANAQMDKFVDKETKEIIIPKDLVRLGGSYEDRGESTVGFNFVKLMDSALIQAGLTQDELLSNIEYTHFKADLKQDSINWVENETDESEDQISDTLTASVNERCNQQYQEVEEIIQNSWGYIKFLIPEQECQEGQLYIENFKATARLEFDASLFVDGLEVSDYLIYKALNDCDWDKIKTGALSINDYQLDISLSDFEIDIGFRSVFITIIYDTSDCEGERCVSKARQYVQNLRRFQEKVVKQTYKNDILSALQQAGLLNIKAKFSESESEELDKVEREVAGTFALSNKTINTRVYEAELLLERVSEEMFKPYFKDHINALENAFVDEFKSLFVVNANREYKSALNQLNLFDQEQYKVKPILFLPKIFDVKLIISKEKPQERTRADYLFTLIFNIKIDFTLTDQEFESSVAFLLAAGTNPDLIKNVAYQSLKPTINTYLLESKTQKKLQESNSKKITIWRKK